MFYPGDHREEPVNQSSSNAGLLRACLAAQSDAGLDWLDATAAQLAGAAPDRALFAAFAAAPGRVGRDELGPCALHDGVHLAGWTRDQAARVLFPASFISLNIAYWMLYGASPGDFEWKDPPSVSH